MTTQISSDASPPATVVPIGGSGVIFRDGASPVSSPPDIAAEYHDEPGLALRAASLRGPGHRASNEPRQDSYAVANTDDWLVAVVADGIGSKRWSHVGSSTAAQAVAAAVILGADPEYLDSLVEAADAACIAAAEALGVSSTDLYTTLTVAAIPKAADNGGSRAATIHEVGDSPALILRGEEPAWTILTSEEKLGCVLVDAVVPSRHENAVTYGVELNPGDVLVLASDGLLEHLGDGTGAYADALARSWTSSPRHLIQFVSDLSTNFASTCQEDDRTTIATWIGSTDSDNLRMRRVPNNYAHEPASGLGDFT